MSNARKSKLLSKRHFRRIITNQTNIDIAGCSDQTSKEIHIIHTSIEDSCDLNLSVINKKDHIFDVNNIIDGLDNESVSLNSEYEHYEHQCETSVVQKNNDQNLYNDTTNNINSNDKKKV